VASDLGDHRGWELAHRQACVAEQLVEPVERGRGRSAELREICARGEHTLRAAHHDGADVAGGAPLIERLGDLLEHRR